MADQKIIAIVGATGAQGGGLARAILADPKGGFAARAITRDPKSEKARELGRRGAEVVAADIDDETSVVQALRGAYGAYFVTFYWAHFAPEKEKEEAKKLARAAKTAGLSHVIWSTLEDTRHWVPLSDDRMPTLMGKYKVPHFDAKGESNKEFRDLGVPTTYLLTSFYWDNLINFGLAPRRGADGKLAFTLPIADAKLPGIAAEDIGRCAYGILKMRKEYVGRTIGIAGEHLTGTEMAAALGEALGEPVRHNAITPEQFRALGFPGADDLGNMFQVMRDFEKEFCAARDVRRSRELNSQLQTFRSWLEANRHLIRIE
jgi:uncharacterized protein YbjT (DUF2867 family)